MTDALYGKYDLNRGIQDILPFVPGALPEKAVLAPTDAARSAMLHTLYAGRGCGSVIASFLRPAVRNLENLRPERYRAGLSQCRKALLGSEDPALAALAELLEEEREQTSLLASFQGLLLEG
ncbi:MAG: hypothetical protein LBD42_05595 [Desulfovibrio sp.]|jgi:hypothetical protein|nr:hypothetical protein [Desulfovibrio sp.]